MKTKLNLITAVAVILILVLSAGCKEPLDAVKSTVDEEAVVIDEGSVSKEREYYVDESGRVIYTDSRELIGESGEVPVERDPSLPAIFMGAQRIYPSGEDAELRESYLTRASFEAIEQFYTAYLERGVLNPNDESTDNVCLLNSIASTDRDGRKQTALFVNYDNVPEGEPQTNARSGMKVLLKEFPDQHAVQIILTTLRETPLGFNPVGVWLTPEEAQQLADEAAEREAAMEEALESITGEGADDEEAGDE